MSGTLMLHDPDMKSRKISLEDLAHVPAPEPMGRLHVPVKHHDAVTQFLAAAKELDYHVVRTELALSGNRMKLFGTFDLAKAGRESEATVAIGLRNANDQRFSLGIVGGTRVFVCDNLAFSGDVKAFTKHMPGIDPGKMYHDTLRKIVEAGTAMLLDLTVLAGVRCSYREGLALMADAYTADAVSPKMLSKSLDLWAESEADPTHRYAPRTAWSAYNCLTESFKLETAADKPIYRSKQLNSMFGRIYPVFRPAEDAAAAAAV